MAVLEIKTYGDPVLRLKAEPVKRVTKRVTKIIKDMVETMYAADGAGLAAPQIGISRQIIVIDVGDGPIVLLNPKLIEEEGEDLDVEGCLSIPGKKAYVKRAAKVRVRAQNEQGKTIEIEGEGMLARALQHEIDHLKGILYIDLVDESEVFIEEDE